MNYDYSLEDSRLPLFVASRSQANVSAIERLNYSLSRERRQDIITMRARGLTQSKNCSCHNRPTEKQSKITKTSKSTQRVKFNIATDSTIQVGSEQSARNQQKQRCMQLDHMILRFVQAHHAVTIAFCTWCELLHLFSNARPSSFNTR